MNGYVKTANVGLGNSEYKNGSMENTDCVKQLLKKMNPLTQLFSSIKGQKLEI